MCFKILFVFVANIIGLNLWYLPSRSFFTGKGQLVHCLPLSLRKLPPADGGDNVSGRCVDGPKLSPVIVDHKEDLTWGSSYWGTHYGRKECEQMQYFAFAPHNLDLAGRRSQRRFRQPYDSNPRTHPSDDTKSPISQEYSGTFGHLASYNIRILTYSNI